MAKNILKSFLVVCMIAVWSASAFAACTWPQGTPPATGLGVISDLAGQAGDGQVTLTWTADTASAGYYLWYGGNDCSINENVPTATVTPSPNSGTITHVVTGLTNNEEYQFSLKNYSGSGLSLTLQTWSNVATATPTAGGSGNTTNGTGDCDWPTSTPPVTGLATISDLAVGTTVNGAIYLTWSADAASDGYYIWATPTSACSIDENTPTATYVPTSNTGTLTYKVEGLTANKNYEFKVRNYSGSGLSQSIQTWSNLAEGISAIELSNKGVFGSTASWATATEMDAAGFHVWRAEGNGKFERITTSLIPAKGSVAGGAQYSVQDAAAVLGKSYTYKLETITTNGASRFIELGSN